MRFWGRFLLPLSPPLPPPPPPFIAAVHRFPFPRRKEPQFRRGTTRRIRKARIIADRPTLGALCRRKQLGPGARALAGVSRPASEPDRTSLNAFQPTHKSPRSFPFVTLFTIGEHTASPGALYAPAGACARARPCLPEMPIPPMRSAERKLRN